MELIYDEEEIVMPQKFFGKKNIVRNLLILGAALCIILSIVAEIFHLPTQNSWYAIVAILIIMTPVCIAGIIYARQVYPLHKDRSILIYTMIGFFGVVMLCCIFSMIIGWPPI